MLHDDATRTKKSSLIRLKYRRKNKTKTLKPLKCDSRKIGQIQLGLSYLNAA